MENLHIYEFIGWWVGNSDGKWPYRTFQLGKSWRIYNAGACRGLLLTLISYTRYSLKIPRILAYSMNHGTASLQVVKETIDPGASVEFKPNTADDPHMRKPDISKAKALLNWEPKISLKQGLPRMVSDFQKRIMDEKWGAGATELRILYHTDGSGASTKLRWRITCLCFLPPGQILFFFVIVHLFFCLGIIDT